MQAIGLRLIEAILFEWVFEPNIGSIIIDPVPIINPN
jgi:hypothetical protein